jgi:hypothetical protein
LGLEPFEGEEGAVPGTARGVEAVLKLGEGVGVAGGGAAERELLLVAILVLILVAPGLGFGFIEAAEGPFAADEIVDEGALGGVGGVEEEVALLGELMEVVGVLAGKDEGLGVEAGFEAVHGRCGLARDRGGAGGFLGVQTVGFYLAERGHGGLLERESELRSDARGWSLMPL